MCATVPPRDDVVHHKVGRGVRVPDRDRVAPAEVSWHRIRTTPAVGARETVSSKHKRSKSRVKRDLELQPTEDRGRRSDRPIEIDPVRWLFSPVKAHACYALRDGCEEEPGRRRWAGSLGSSELRAHRRPMCTTRRASTTSASPQSATSSAGLYRVIESPEKRTASACR